MEAFELYAIRNKDGLWFRRKGYGGGGSTWVKDFAKARIYTKTGGARNVISWFANSYPEYGVPDLVVLKITSVEALDETHRIETAKQRKKQKEEKLLLRRKKNELDRATKAFEEAKMRLERAQQS